MQLKVIGSNQTELEFSDGTTVFFSYETPVAIFVPKQGALCTSQKYSSTTSKHINNTVKRWGATRHNVSQAEIDKIANNLLGR
jgi:hypothetical protein